MLLVGIITVELLLSQAFCLQQLGCELLVNSHGSVLIILPTVISYDQA